MRVQVLRERDRVAVVASDAQMLADDDAFAAAGVARITAEQALTMSAQVLDSVNQLVPLSVVAAGADQDLDASGSIDAGGAVKVRIEQLELMLTLSDAVQFAKDSARVADQILTEVDTF